MRGANYLSAEEGGWRQGGSVSAAGVVLGAVPVQREGIPPEVLAGGFGRLRSGGWRGCLETPHGGGGLKVMTSALAYAVAVCLSVGVLADAVLLSRWLSVPVGPSWGLGGLCGWVAERDLSCSRIGCDFGWDGFVGADAAPRCTGERLGGVVGCWPRWADEFAVEWGDRD